MRDLELRAAIRRDDVDHLCNSHLAGLALTCGLVNYALKQGAHACALYMHTQGCVWSNIAARCAATSPVCLRLVISTGGDVSDDVCSTAAKAGCLECLVIAHQHGGILGHLAARYAARKGHLGCLRYTHEQGVSINSDVMHQAEYGGHLQCLQYAHEHGGELTWLGYAVNLSRAVWQHKADGLQYYLDHGGAPPVPADPCSVEIYNWMIESIFGNERALGMRA